MRVQRGQLTESPDYCGFVFQKQRGVVKCRGREKDGEKLVEREGNPPRNVYPSP